MIRKILRWIDEQTQLVSRVREFMEEPLAKGVGWPHIFGSGAMFLFIVQAITGILLMVYYVPSPNAAYESTSYITHELPLGGLVRGLHHWGASLMLVMVVLHMLQAFFWGAYKRPRQIIWVIGVLLLLVTMGLSFTGYLLPWDQKAYWATVVGTRIAGSVPVVGHHITVLMRGGEDIGALTLSRFFAVHVLIFPAILVGLMLFHVAQVRRKGITPPGRRAGEEENVEHTTLFYPDQVFKDAVLAVGLLAILFILAITHAAGLEAKADPSAPGYVPRPEWYFLPSFQLLKYIPTAWGEWGEFFGAAVIPGLIVLVLVLLPYLDRNPERRASRRPFASSAAIVGLAILGYLGYAGAMSGPREVELTALQSHGEKTFLDLRCNSCHGINGGGGIEGQDLAPDGPRDPDRVAAILRSPTAFTPRSIMPAVSEDVSDEEFRALVEYVAVIDSSFHMPLEAIGFGPQRPSSHTEQNWFANHKFEVRKDPTTCVECHKPSFCQSCHRNRRPDSHGSGWLKSHFGTAQERPEYCQVCHDQDFCSACHDRIMHTDDWMERHADVSPTDSELCASCHKPDFCVTCHGGATPTSHVEGWVRMHAKAPPEDCGTCHSQSFCSSCHEGARPASHDPRWVEGHSERAKEDQEACTTCHRVEFCQSCHGGVQMPHPGDWLMGHKPEASFAGESACFRCHSYKEKCAQCHGAEMPQS